MPAWAVTVILAAVAAITAAATPSLGVRTAPSTVRGPAVDHPKPRISLQQSIPSEASVIQNWIAAREAGDADAALAACHSTVEFLSPRVNAYGQTEARGLFTKAFPATKTIKQLTAKDGVWTREFSFSPVPFVNVRIRQSFTMKREYGGGFKIQRIENINI